MRVAVLGAGMIGSTVVRELVKYSIIGEVYVIDALATNIHTCLSVVNHSKVNGEVVDLGKEKVLHDVLLTVDIAISCLPHNLSMTVTKAAIKAKCHLIDLVGSQFEEKLLLDEQAKAAGVIIMPGCGVAPGITNILAARGIDLLDEAKTVTMLCGGLPRYPTGPLKYQIVFRLESLLALYTREALAVQGGELVKLPPLTGLEEVQFPEPIGACEAVITDAYSTAYTLKDKVDQLYEKTVRYAGHWEKVQTLVELGFLNDTPIENNDSHISPRTFTEKILAPNLAGKSVEDVTVLRVEVNGFKKGKAYTYQWEMIDFYDKKRQITSMAKTTAIPATIIATWIAEGRITETGVLPPEQVIIGDRFQPFMETLTIKGIEIKFN